MTDKKEKKKKGEQEVIPKGVDEDQLRNRNPEENKEAEKALGTDADGAPIAKPSMPETAQKNLLEYIRTTDETVQSLIGGETVEYSSITHTFEIFHIPGCDAKIRDDIFETMPERIAQMSNEKDEKTKKPKFTKEAIEKIITAWCVNRVRARKDERATRDNFWSLVQFVREIVFNEDAKSRANPPKGITKTKAISKYHQWESFKFVVKIPYDTMIRLEAKVRKKREKGKKKAVYMAEAESITVIFLQKSMRVKPGQYVTGAGFANYFKVMHKAMFPPEFGDPGN